MKFNRELDVAARRMPQYRHCFIDYRKLKFLVKECQVIAAAASPIESDEDEDAPSSVHETRGEVGLEEQRFFATLRLQMKDFDANWSRLLEGVEERAKELRQLLLAIIPDADRCAPLSSDDLSSAVPDAKGYGSLSLSSARTALGSGSHRFLRGPLRRGKMDVYKALKELHAAVLDVTELRRLGAEAVRKILKKFDKQVPGCRTQAEQDRFTRFDVGAHAFASPDRVTAVAEAVRHSLRSCYIAGDVGDQRYLECIEGIAANRELEQKNNLKGDSVLQSMRPYLGFLVVLSVIMVLLSLAQPNFRPNNPDLNWQGYAVVAGISTAIFAIAVLEAPSDVSLMSATTLFMVLRIIDLERAFVGFGNPGVIANGILLPFARALMLAGGAERVLVRCMGGPRTNTVLAVAQCRMAVVVAAFSSVLNNTPIVYMMIPILRTWCTKVNHSVSKFMMPMSFAIMLGGTCSIIGSSANLVVVGRAQTFTGHYPPDKAPQFADPPFFMPAWVGLPVCILGAIWMTVTAPMLLPARIGKPGEGGGAADGQTVKTFRGRNFSSSSKFIVGFRFTAPLIGQRVSDTGVTRLIPGVSVDYIQRPSGDGTPPDSADAAADEAPSPLPSKGRVRGAEVAEHVVADGDVAVFRVGSTEVNALRQMQGLQLTGKTHKLCIDRRKRCLIEVTLGASSQLLGTHVTWDQRTARTMLLGFDSVGELGAACLGVHFKDSGDAEAGSDERVDRVRSRRLVEGDTLLIEGSFPAGGVWDSYFSHIVVVEDSVPPMRDPKKAYITLGSLAVMVFVTSQQLLDIVTISFVLVPLFIVTGVLSPREAWGSVKGDVLLTVAASFGIGEAMTASGLASWLGTQISTLSHGDEVVLLFLLYTFTVMAGTVLNNAAVAVLVYPVTYCAAVEDFGLDPSMIVILVIMGAGLSFVTPMSYQTNQMVQEPGGYTFGDYVRYGGALQLFTGVASVLILYFLAANGWIKHYHGLGPPPCSPNC
eukprot:TRINITY_DN801_c15_g1_i1.p1 TRINITY_DN801_c15_g1~~TRINITY_DN801_c15_g1_i1.p1  ORF type:complete len:988 (+),score=333.17 TRINITY_DN801_c15_g1_i1:85-3048(+)